MNQQTTELVAVDYGNMPDQARAFAASGFFSDARRQSQALTKMITGQELGIGLMASMTGIHVIPSKGGTKVQIGSNILAALLRRHETYDYRIVSLDGEKCELRFTRDGQDLEPTIVFTIEMAQKANLAHKDNWKHHPRNMLFARALSDGVKFHAPDLATGMPIYTEGDYIDDMVEVPQGGPINDLDVEGQVVEAEVVEPEPETPTDPPATVGQQATIAGIIETSNIDESRITTQLTAMGVVSLDDLTEPQANSMINWLQAQVGTEVPS